MVRATIQLVRSQAEVLMPVITVYGIPSKTEYLSELIKGLRQATSGVEELKLEINQVSVFIPQDACPEGLGEEIIVMVDGLFKKPERTPAVLHKLARALCDAVASFSDPTGLDGERVVPCGLIEVFVKLFDPEKEGFAQLQRPPK